ncbi:MAG: M12 family metallopeptidase [bacterium]
MAIALKSANRHAAPRWEGPVVPFTISPQVPSNLVKSIEDAIRKVEEATSVRFVRRMSENDFVEFHHGQDACNSALGRTGAKQHVTLFPNCTVGNIIHEIGHALGLVHEHQRPDRDAVVDVKEENVRPDKLGNFGVVKDSDTIRSVDYDSQSIMHYSSMTFSENGQPTLLAKDPGTVLDGSTTFTSEDEAFLRKAEFYPYRGIVRRSDSSDKGAGQVQGIAVARDDIDNLIVTAVRTGSGTLLLIAWQIGADGSVMRLADSGDLAGHASSVSITKGGRYVTAVRSGSGKLLLITWTVAQNAIMRGPDSGDLAGEADLVRIISVKDTLFVTACRSASGTLLLITWKVDANGIHRLKTAEAGAVSEISLIRLHKGSTQQQVMTTVRSASGTALSIVWTVHDNGKIERLGDSGDLMGKATSISSCRVDSDHVVVACKTPSGNLRLINLLISDDGKSVSRVGDSGDAAGAISEVSLFVPPKVPSLIKPKGVRVITAVRSGKGHLLLIGWWVSTGGAITRMGDSGPDQAGKADMINVGPNTSSPNAPILTTVRTGSGTLKLITWDDQSEHGEL